MEYIVSVGRPEEMESLGAERLIRCKDCRHRDPEDKKCDHGDMIHINHQFPMPDDWFCPLGEIKGR